MNMSKHANEITVCEAKKWVRDLFKDEDIDIPDLEKNPECMRLLSRIIFVNRDAEKDAEEIIKTNTQLADLYKRKSEEISSSFCQTLSVNDLEPSARGNIEKLASAATELKLEKPTITNFLLRSSDLDNKKSLSMEQDLINVFTQSKLSKKVADIMQKNENLQRDIEELEKKVSKQSAVKLEMNKEMKFFKMKGIDYKKRIKKCEAQLKKHEWNNSLSHSELVERSKEIENLEHKINNISEKLESYQDLPPNEMLARFKVEEAHEELSRLQEEFENLLFRS